MPKFEKTGDSEKKKVGVLEKAYIAALSKLNADATIKNLTSKKEGFVKEVFSLVAPHMKESGKDKVIILPTVTENPDIIVKLQGSAPKRGLVANWYFMLEDKLDDSDLNKVVDYIPTLKDGALDYLLKEGKISKDEYNSLMPEKKGRVSRVIKFNK